MHELTDDGLFCDAVFVRRGTPLLYFMYFAAVLYNRSVGLHVC